MKNYPSHTLYAVTQGDEQTKAEWLPIGVAFTNKDGSLSLVYDAGKPTQPAGSRLVLRTRKPRAAASDTSNQGGQQ